MKMHSDELQLFIAVVESGSLSAAAHRLQQTPSAVSRGLSRLEEKLNVTLINRTTRRMQITEEGQYFLQQARDIVQQMDALACSLEDRQQTPSGRLRVNAALPFMLHAVVPWMAEFRQRYPAIELELNTDDWVIDLLEQNTDVAIRLGELADSGMHARLLGCSPRHVVASPDYWAQHGKPQRVAELNGHRLLGFSQNPNLNQWPLLHEQGDRWSITPALTASSGETLRQLALAGEGVACLAHFVVHEDLRAGRLQAVLTEHDSGYRQPIHAVYYRNASLAARIQCFLDFMQEKLAQYAC